MSASASTRLRQLATQYHGGELSLQNYRRLRAELLDRLTCVDTEPDESSTTLPKYPRPPAVLPAATATPAMPAAPAMPTTSAPMPAKLALPPPAPQPPRAQPTAAPRTAHPVHAPQPASPAPAPVPARRGGAGKVVVMLMFAGAIAAGAFWYFKLRPDTSPSANAEQAAPTTESYRAIKDFLTTDDWSDEQIANFNSRWSTLPDDMRVAAIDDAWYQDFVGRVRSQVKERRALTATAERAGNVDGPLFALASSLGIDVSSPDAVVVPSRIRPNDAGEQSGTPRAVALKPAISLPSAPQTKDADAPPPTATAATPVTPTGATKPATTVTHPVGAAKTGLVNTADVPNPDKCRVELVGSRKPRCRDALNVGGFGPFLAMIPAGGFDMGSKQGTQEQPVHPVTIAKPFAVAEFETSQAEYQLFCTHTKRSCQAQPWPGSDFPVVRVSWQDARDYATWLSEISGKTYRLATEAEWEFAARGGGSALFPSGDALSQTDAVFSVADKLAAPWPRSQKINANAFRLYHSIGNVREWVADAWVPNFTGAPSDGSARAAGDAAQRVVRGGAYTDAAPKLRFTTREGVDATTRDLITGFRVVREL